jgi:hypothetical protein
MNKKKKQLQWAINPVTVQMMVRETEPKKRGRMSIQNDNGHWWCQRFHDFTDKENVELCRQYPMSE